MIFGPRPSIPVALVASSLWSAGTSGGKYAINFAVKNSANKSLITLQKNLEVCRETYIVLRYWIYLNSSVSCVKLFHILKK